MMTLRPLPIAIGLLIGACCAVTLGEGMANLAVPRTVAWDPLLDRLPRTIGAWQAVPDVVTPIDPAPPDDFGRPTNIYDKVVTRSYRNPAGVTIALVIAYKVVEHQEDRVHSPEFCYFAQGFAVTDPAPFRLSGPLPLPVSSFTANRHGITEDVLFWIRTGDVVSQRALTARSAIFASALRGRLVDGVVVRASIPSVLDPTSGNSAEHRRLLDAFLGELLQGAPTDVAMLLAGPDRAVR